MKVNLSLSFAHIILIAVEGTYLHPCDRLIMPKSILSLVHNIGQISPFGGFVVLLNLLHAKHIEYLWCLKTTKKTYFCGLKPNHVFVVP